MNKPAENLSYRKIKEIVLERIKANHWPPDSFLPSEVDLVEEFSSTRTTVNRALRELADEGYLERKRKAGTKVVSSPIRKAQFAIPLVRDEIAATGAEYRYALVERKKMVIPAWLAAQLNISKQQNVLFLRCMHYADNAPFQYETRWIVPNAVPEVFDETFTEEGPNDWLVKRVPFTSLELSLTATKADQDIAEFLNLMPGDPVFSAERTTWLRDAPVTFAKLFFAQGYKLTTRI